VHRILTAFFFCTSVIFAEWKRELLPFLELHCYDCHGDGAKKGGLAMDQLSYDLEDPATFVTWERIYDRAMSGEMPPKKILERPSANELAVFSRHLEPPLVDAHSKEKGTVVRI
jgi:mono/diheme cytochrome c family protein